MAVILVEGDKVHGGHRDCRGRGAQSLEIPRAELGPAVRSHATLGARYELTLWFASRTCLVRCQRHVYVQLKTRSVAERVACRAQVRLVMLVRLMDWNHSPVGRACPALCATGIR
jgi:hypothetical protein